MKLSVNIRCVYFGQVDDAMLARLRKGVQLEDGPANFKEIKFTGGVGINNGMT